MATITPYLGSKLGYHTDRDPVRPLPPPNFNLNVAQQAHHPLLEPAQLDFLPVAQLVTSDSMERGTVTAQIVSSDFVMAPPLPPPNLFPMVSSPISRHSSDSPIGTNPGGTWFLHEFDAHREENKGNAMMNLFFCGVLDSLMPTEDHLDREVLYRDPVSGQFHSSDGVYRFVTGRVTPL